MRRLIIALALVLITSASAWAAEDSIRVLILDGAFTNTPEKGEKLTRIEKVDGDLLIDDIKYMGKIVIYKGKNGLYLVDEVPFEKYVEAVVSSEAGPDWNINALKAQAVITRTYAMNQKLKEDPGAVYDITSSVLHQLYRGDSGTPTVERAVQETQGEILTYEGLPIMALYHSTSEGMTESADEVFGKNYPYLKPVVSTSALSPLKSWVRRIPLDEISLLTGVKGITDIRTVSLTCTGRVKELEMCSAGGNKVFETKDLRRIIGWKRLPSTDFTYKIEGGVCIFDGKGWGHGVGLCQWCAEEMAAGGKSYKDILNYYYPGATLTRHAG